MDAATRVGELTDNPARFLACSQQIDKIIAGQLDKYKLPGTYTIDSIGLRPARLSLREKLRAMTPDERRAWFQQNRASLMPGEDDDHA